MTNEHSILSMEQHMQFLNMEEARKYICDSDVGESLRILREAKKYLCSPNEAIKISRSRQAIPSSRYYICYAILCIDNPKVSIDLWRQMAKTLQKYVTTALSLSYNRTIEQYMHRHVNAKWPFDSGKIMQCRHDVLQCLIKDLTKRSTTK